MKEESGELAVEVDPVSIPANLQKKRAMWMCDDVSELLTPLKSSQSSLSSVAPALQLTETCPPAL